MKNWIITTSELVGLSHIPKNIPCQDKTHQLVQNGVSVLALSDGCGSSSLSHIGAKITVETLCEVLSTSFHDILKMDALTSRDFILEKVIAALEEYVEEHQVSIKDLNATFMFVAVDKHDTALIGHIGDGYVGAVQNGQLVIKSLEKKTGEVNGTVYPTSIHAKYFLQLKRGPAKDIDAFVLMSDGSGDGLVDSRIPFVKKFAPHVAGIIEYTSTHPEEENQEFMDKLLERVRDHIFSEDDCSLAIMTKPNTSVESIEPYELERPEEGTEEVNTKTIDETASELRNVEHVYYYLKEAEVDTDVLPKKDIEVIVRQLEANKSIEEIISDGTYDETVVTQVKHILYELKENN